MAAGDLLTADGQIEVGGTGTAILLGTTSYQIIDWDLFPELSIDEATEQANGDGLIVARQLAGAARLTVDVQCLGTGSTIMTNRNALAAATALTTTEGYLAFQVGGSKYLYHGRWMRGATTARVGLPMRLRFLSPEPAFYSCTVTTTTVDASETVTNAGNRSSGWEVVVTPPSVALVGPYVRRLDDSSYTIKYSGTVAVGETLRINTRTRVAVKDGSDVSHLLSDGAGNVPAWWRLAPGANSVGGGAVSGFTSFSLTHRAGYEV